MKRNMKLSVQTVKPQKLLIYDWLKSQSLLSCVRNWFAVRRIK